MPVTETTKKPVAIKPKIWRTDTYFGVMLPNDTSEADRTALMEKLETKIKEITGGVRLDNRSEDERRFPGSPNPSRGQAFSEVQSRLKDCQKPHTAVNTTAFDDAYCRVGTHLICYFSFEVSDTQGNETFVDFSPEPLRLLAGTSYEPVN